LLGPIAHPSFDERELVAGEVERFERPREQRFERPREAAHAADRSARTLEIDAVEVAPGRARAVAREDDRAARDPRAPLAAPRPRETGEAAVTAAREVVETEVAVARTADLARG